LRLIDAVLRPSDAHRYGARQHSGKED
jgi:hypothetical protein